MKLIEQVFRLLTIVLKGVFGLLTFLVDPSHIWTSHGKYQAKRLSWWQRFTLINSFNYGVSVNGKWQSTIHNAKSHFLIVGRSGIGKTSVFSVVNLLKWNNSSVTVDMQGELWRLCSADLERRGIVAKKIDLIDLLCSEFWNPVSNCKNDSERKELAKTLIKTAMPNPSQEGNFWNLMAENYLYTGLRILSYQDKSHNNLVNLRHLILNWDSLDSLVSDNIPFDIFNEYASTTSQDPKLRSSAISTALSALEPFTDEGIGFITSKTTLDFSELTQKKTALFLVMSEAKLPLYSPILSIFFQQMFSYIQLNKPLKPILCVLDEAGQYYIPNLPSLASVLRRYNTILCLLIQDWSQMVHLYSKTGSDSIWNGSTATKIIFTWSYELAQKMSHAYGRKSIIMDSPNDDDKRYHSDRELNTIDDLMLMKEGMASFIFRSKPMKFISVYPYFRQARLRRRTKRKPKQVTQNVWHKVVLLPIPKSPLQ